MDDKRTWMKIHTGILSPKHRDKMGVCVWLFMHLIDHADWETGTVEGFTDQAAADVLEMPKSTLTKWRLKLQDEGYITSEQGFQSQRIIIHRWRNPREVNPPQINTPEPDLFEIEITWSPKLGTSQFWVAMPPAKWVPFLTDQILITNIVNGNLTIESIDNSGDENEAQPLPDWNECEQAFLEVGWCGTREINFYLNMNFGKASKGKWANGNIDRPMTPEQIRQFPNWWHKNKRLGGAGMDKSISLPKDPLKFGDYVEAYQKHCEQPPAPTTHISNERDTGAVFDVFAPRFDVDGRYIPEDETDAERTAA